jgi:hypothetical protein
MGSSGTGNFSDYPGSSGGSKSKGNGASQGQSGDHNRCENNLTVNLEEVSSCAYYKNHKSVPPEQTDVNVISKLVGGRIGVQVTTDNELVGYLPTEYNYLLQCMKQGYSYNGTVTSSALKPTPRISIELRALK